MHGDEPTQRPAVVSVVVPAHDEARVVGGCLDRLAPLVADGRAEVVVVANGCTDDTAEVARARGVKVVELVEPSKPAALDAGDAAVSAFPRVYLDADVDLGPDALLALAAALPDDVPAVASPRVRFDVAGRPWAVRAWYRTYTALPYVSAGLVGLGCYAVSRAGRERFAGFPAITADDLFVQRRFAPVERRVLADHEFVVRTPRTLAALVRVRTRAVAGMRELDAIEPGRETTADSGRALLRLAVRNPLRLPDVLVYVGVTLAARRRAGSATTRWERDDTTR